MKPTEADKLAANEAIRRAWPNGIKSVADLRASFAQALADEREAMRERCATHLEGIKGLLREERACMSWAAERIRRLP